MYTFDSLVHSPAAIQTMYIFDSLVHSPAAIQTMYTFDSLVQWSICCQNRRYLLSHSREREAGRETLLIIYSNETFDVFDVTDTNV